MSRVTISAGPVAIELEDEDETSETLVQLALDTLDGLLERIDDIGSEDKDG